MINNYTKELLFEKHVNSNLKFSRWTYVSDFAKNMSLEDNHIKFFSLIIK